MDSILISIKKLLGITEDYDHFDDDLVMHINAVFMNLKQLGIGPEEGFRIEDDTAVWDEFVNATENPELVTMLSSIKTYIHLKVKMVFDPPLSSAVMEAMKQSIAEVEWRLNIEAESK